MSRLKREPLLLQLRKLAAFTGYDESSQSGAKPAHIGDREALTGPKLVILRKLRVALEPSSSNVAGNSR